MTTLARVRYLAARIEAGEHLSKTFIELAYRVNVDRPVPPIVQRYVTDIAVGKINTGKGAVQPFVDGTRDEAVGYNYPRFLQHMPERRWPKKPPPFYAPLR